MLVTECWTSGEPLQDKGGHPCCTGSAISETTPAGSDGFTDAVKHPPPSESLLEEAVGVQSIKSPCSSEKEIKSSADIFIAEDSNLDAVSGLMDKKSLPELTDEEYTILLRGEALREFESKRILGIDRKGRY